MLILISFLLEPNFLTGLVRILFYFFPKDDDNHHCHGVDDDGVWDFLLLMYPLCFSNLCFAFCSANCVLQLVLCSQIAFCNCVLQLRVASCVLQLVLCKLFALQHCFASRVLPTHFSNLSFAIVFCTLCLLLVFCKSCFAFVFAIVCCGWSPNRCNTHDVLTDATPNKS